MKSINWSRCEYCLDEEVSLVDYFGFALCQSCIEMEETTDWDKFEDDRRRRIAENNEF